MSLRRSSILNEKVEIEPDDRNVKIEKRKNSKISFIRSNFKDFTSHTSLHGFQYLGENGINWGERVWWLIMIIISVGICCGMIIKILDKWNLNPVIVSFSETQIPVFQIPFPAITICPETKIMQSNYKSMNIFNKSIEYDEEGMLKVSSAALLCENTDYISEEYYEHLNISDDVSIEFLKNITNVNFLTNCLSRDEEIDCEEIFLPITTDAGFCKTFNLLDSQELFREVAFQYDEYNVSERPKTSGWNLETGYDKNEEFSTFPMRGLSPHLGSGLSVILNFNNVDIDYVCTGTTQGFRISLDSPANFPMMQQEFFIAPFNQEVLVYIKPEMIYTSVGLKNYDPNKRQCYTTNERRLKYFKMYTQRNCQVECLSNATTSICDCVPFWMPREKDTPICNLNELFCVKLVRAVVYRSEIKRSMGKNQRKPTRKGFTFDCNCLPACTLLNYGVEVSQVDYRFREMLEVFSDATEITNISLTKIKFYFKGSDFIPSRRSELYGLADFLANCGGILGLFLGFSILSLVEIIYFLTLRPICGIVNLLKSKRKKICKA